MNTWKELGFSVMQARGYYDYQKIPLVQLGCKSYFSSGSLSHRQDQTLTAACSLKAHLAHFRRFQVRLSCATVQQAFIQNKRK